jgi:hypothetical protein
MIDLVELTVSERRLAYELCKQSYDKRSKYLFRFRKGLSAILYLDGDANTAYVVFTGSKFRFYDWRRNFRFIATKTNYGKCHGGYNAEAVKFHHLLAQLLPRHCKIIWGGHSRGGGLSQIFAMHFHNNYSQYYEFAGGITFGSPKVFKGPLTNVPPFQHCVNTCDMVTRTPISLVGDDWEHHGISIVKSIDVRGIDHGLEVYGQWV